MKMMGQTHCLSEHYTKLYLCALLLLAKEYAEWKASSQPSIPTKPLSSNISNSQSCKVNKTHKPKEGVSPPPEIETNVCERETPSHQDISSLTTYRDNCVCQVKTTSMEQEVIKPSHVECSPVRILTDVSPSIMEQEEISISPHVECLPATDVADTSTDPSEDQQP